jgi:hypothetical protein
MQIIYDLLNLNKKIKDIITNSKTHLEIENKYFLKLINSLNNNMDQSDSINKDILSLIHKEKFNDLINNKLNRNPTYQKLNPDIKNIISNVAKQIKLVNTSNINNIFEDIKMNTIHTSKRNEEKYIKKIKPLYPKLDTRFDQEMATHYNLTKNHITNLYNNIEKIKQHYISQVHEEEHKFLDILKKRNLSPTIKNEVFIFNYKMDLLNNHLYDRLKIEKDHYEHSIASLNKYPTLLTEDTQKRITEDNKNFNEKKVNKIAKTLLKQTKTFKELEKVVLEKTGITALKKEAAKEAAKLASTVAEKSGITALKKEAEKLASKVAEKVGIKSGEKTGVKVGEKAAEKTGITALKKEAGKLASKVAEKLGVKVGEKAGAKVAEKSAGTITKMMEKLSSGPAVLIILALELILYNVLNLDPSNFKDCPKGQYDLNKLPEAVKTIISLVPGLSDIFDMIGDKLCFNPGCPKDTKLESGLCYKKCDPGYKSDGGVMCYKQYPEFENNGKLHTLTNITKDIKLNTGVPVSSCKRLKEGYENYDDPKCKALKQTIEFFGNNTISEGFAYRRHRRHFDPRRGFKYGRYYNPRREFAYGRYYNPRRRFKYRQPTKPSGPIYEEDDKEIQE